MAFGKGKFWVFFFFLLPGGLTSAQEGKSFIYHFNSDMDANSVVSNDRSIILNYSISSLEFKSITGQNGEFYRITIPGHNKTSEAGKPEIPVFSRLINVPEGGDVIVRITNVKSATILPAGQKIKGLLYPRQIDEAKQNDKQRTGFVIDRELYSSRELIKSDTVRIEYIGSVRNNRLATVYISPVRYNPFLNKLEVITSMTVEIDFPGSESKSSAGQDVSPLFDESLGKGLLNYNPADVLNGYSDKPVSMIILTDTSFRKALKPYITWKTQKGFKVTTLYKGATFAGNSFTEIKDSLKNIYNSSTIDNPAPEYLLIVGDVSRIPASEGTSQLSDMYWGEFNGNGDYLPDMYIGRLPVPDTATLRTVLEKIIKYEKFEFADTNKFYKRSLISAGNEPSYQDLMNGQLRYATNYYLNPANNIEGHVFYYPQSYTSEDTIKKLINSGVGFVNYTGHGAISGWLDPVIKIPEIALFTNKNMYPFIISNACQTAHYNQAESMGNKMIVSKDKGAIGFIGCSNDSYWDEDFYWAVGVGTPVADPKYEETGLGALDRLFHTNGEKPPEWYITMGQVNYAGNLAVSSSTSIRKKYYWETYTLLGDPSMIPLIGTPGNFSVTLPDTIPNGIRSLSLTVDPFAYVAVSHWDTLWDASFSSPSGSVVLDLPYRSNDSCLVVITGQNKKPVIKKIYIGAVQKEFINLSKTVISDVTGNDNGLADYNETVFLKLTISNLGLTDASGLTATLSTDSFLVTLLNDNVNIGTLPARSEITLSDNFELSVSELVPDKAVATFNLKLKDTKTEKNYRIDVMLHAPMLEILSCTIDDSVTGNNNLSADPGETIKLVFTVNNSGSSETSGILNVSGYPADIIISQPSVNTGIVNPGQITKVNVTATISPLMTKGSSFDITSLLDCSPYIVNKSFSIPVGKTRESFEYQSFTIFPWQNSLSYPWLITDQQSNEGNFSARSGFIPNSSESILRLTVNVPRADTIKFFHKVSSELSWDFLIFRLNGTQQLKVSGEAGWAEKKYILREGFNFLEWIYRKDESYSSGSDCAWIDYITFPSASFNRIDLKTGKILTPQPNKSYTLEPITAEVINFGTDTIKGFNLAYSLDAGLPVYQNFTSRIDPGDTATVAFTTPANLAGNGTYLLRVYGFNNNDEYIRNDTASLTIVNTAITPIENPENKLTIMPNPFTSSFRILLSLDEADQAQLTIYDAAGKALWEKLISLVPGENIITITPDNLPKGFYTMRLRGRTILKAARLIKR